MASLNYVPINMNVEQYEKCIYAPPVTVQKKILEVKNTLANVPYCRVGEKNFYE